MKVLLIDNYDSFTYNLYQFIEEAGARCQVVRNDRITLNQIRKLNPDRIVISPGPGGPDDAGISSHILLRFGSQTPVLGVCLGHQVIGKVFGGKVKKAKRPFHGKTSAIYHNDHGIFRNLPNPFTATRYHSLIVENESLPDSLENTAQTADGTLMGIRHRQYPVFGVQFHPESILTQNGNQLIHNFLTMEGTC